MSAPIKQHLIDPEICIRCYTCEMTCQVEAITHDDVNVVVDAEKCGSCMDCIPVCPTGSIDEWRIVATPYSLEDQFGFEELPAQEEVAEGGDTPEALDEAMAALLAKAHAGAGGKARAPATASKPTINLYGFGKPAKAKVTGNYRLTAQGSDNDVRQIFLDFGGQPMPVLEGQSIGIIPPGTDAGGKPHLPRLYSVSSPRDGERPGFNTLSLTVKREAQGICSNYICDLQPGAEVQITGPFGATFLMPNDPDAELLMICTGTGSAPFRGFTMHRQRENPGNTGKLSLVFGARRAAELPYFGPLGKVPDTFLHKVFAFSRADGARKAYVQDKLRSDPDRYVAFLKSPKAHIYMCGVRDMEQGVDQAFADIARGAGLDWPRLRDAMREDGRYHVETY